jgi:hypothetical protein
MGSAGRMAAGRRRHLAALGRVAPVNLGTRQDYPAAAIEGKAAVEFVGTKSADEAKQLRTYVIKLGRATWQSRVLIWTSWAFRRPRPRPPFHSPGRCRQSQRRLGLENPSR